MGAPGAGWAVVWRGATEAEAELTAGQLRAAGFAAVVEGAQTPSLAAAFPLGGAWLIRVPAGDAAAARALLEEVGEGRNLEQDEEGGLLNADQRATLKAAGAGLVLVALLVLLSLIREAAG